MPPARTPEGKYVLYRVTDGKRFDRWPVDARDLLGTGGYTADPPEGVDPPVLAVAFGPAGAPAPLPAEHSPGVPLVAMKSEDAPPAAPIRLPGPAGRGRR